MKTGREQPKVVTLRKYDIEALRNGEALVSQDKVSGEWFLQYHGHLSERVSLTQVGRLIDSGVLVPLIEENWDTNEVGHFGSYIAK